MSTITTPSTIESLSLVITQEIQVRANLNDTFAALLEQVGTGFETPDGVSLSMKLEAWPGGRWYRDLGDNNGHCWGHVQAIKRPTLLELSGPLFMSYAVTSNLQYRLTEEKGGTLIHFQHKAFGVIPDLDRERMGHGWGHNLDRVRAKAESR
jgi:uncharacterized protein YndB with AHSA1/START domain